MFPVAFVTDFLHHAGVKIAGKTGQGIGVGIWNQRLGIFFLVCAAVITIVFTGINEYPVIFLMQGYPVDKGTEPVIVGTKSI